MNMPSSCTVDQVKVMVRSADSPCMSLQLEVKIREAAFHVNEIFTICGVDDYGVIKHGGR
jgi:hypothetical protein